MATISDHPVTGRIQSGLMAVLTSTITHGVILVLILWRTGPNMVREFSQILPALYLYAPDRRPAPPRETRFPFELTRGIRDGSDLPPPNSKPGGEPLPARTDQKLGVPPPGRTTIRIDSVFSAIAVDSEVVRYPSANPIYPRDLLEGGIEGTVDAEFVVDTSGRVDLTSVNVLTSTHEEFSSSVQSSLAGALFRPAWRNLIKVRQLVRQRFSFKIYRGPDSVSM
jgi:TonB family protein